MLFQVCRVHEKNKGGQWDRGCWSGICWQDLCRLDGWERSLPLFCFQQELQSRLQVSSLLLITFFVQGCYHWGRDSSKPMEWDNNPHTDHRRKSGWKSPWGSHSTCRKSVCYQCDGWDFEGGLVSRSGSVWRGLWGGRSREQARILPSYPEQHVWCPLWQVVNHPPYLLLLLSSSCMEGTWKLEFTSGTQKQFRYWSSDFKYRCNFVFTVLNW